MLLVRKRNQLDQIATDTSRDPEIELKLRDIRCRAATLAIIVGAGLEPTDAREESNGSMQILLIEDDPSLRQSLSSLLRETGFAVDVAFNGDEGLAMAQQSEYDAIILELSEANRDGASILKELRHSDKRTPLLMLTSEDSSQDSVKWLDSGADDCLAKPIETPELEARLRALIRRASIKPNTMIELGPVAVDKIAKAVTVNGIRVPLTNKEYQLLEFLAENRGHVVTRTRIYERLFNEIDNSFANLVDVYVSNIRRKMGHPLIKTMRGRGYLIEK